LTYQIISENVKVTVPVALAGAPAAGESVTTYWNDALVVPGPGVNVNEPFAFIESFEPSPNVQSNGAVVWAPPTMGVIEKG
jgi:hypothetical protein